MSRNSCMYWAISFLCNSSQQWFYWKIFKISVILCVHACTCVFWHACVAWPKCVSQNNFVDFFPFFPLFPGFQELRLRLSTLRRSTLCCLFSVKLVQAFIWKREPRLKRLSPPDWSVGCPHQIDQWGAHGEMLLLTINVEDPAHCCWCHP